MMWVFIYIILVHWICDFVFQSRLMGENKGKDNFWLTAHVSVYTFFTILLWIFGFSLIGISIGAKTVWLAFSLVFVSHWITDYITSRLTGKFYLEKRWYSFFNTIGFDQVLHYIQLFSVYTYIILS